jgi:type I restriction enzyme S subunit
MSNKTNVGGGVPKLRFPEFWDGDEWEPTTLGPKTAKVGSGITPRGGEKNGVVDQMSLWADQISL